jgi:hypothetical protein
MKYNPPTIIDSLPNLSIKDLREGGYFNSWGYREGVLTFKSTSFVRPCVFSISVGLSTQFGNQYIEFEYLCNGELMKYAIPLVRGNNDNLKIGGLWYFQTSEGKKCRKLYLFDKKFINRASIEGGLYYCQVKSRKWREWESYLKTADKLLMITKGGYKKYRKPLYRGKVTRTETKIHNATVKMVNLDHLQLV